MSIELLAPITAFRRCPSERTSPPGHCIATPATWRPSPGSGSSSRSPRRGCSPAKSAPARPWLFGPRSPTRLVAPYRRLPRQPDDRRPRNARSDRQPARRGSPGPRRGARPTDGRPPRAGVRRAGEEGDPRGRRGSPALPEQLEGLRLLMNAELDSVSPFSLVLCGQPTLRRRIRLGAFAALEQRIALRYHLQGMSASETGDYIAHHLALAGQQPAVLRRRQLAHTPGEPRPAPRGEQPGGPVPRRRLR